jgi:hypothetical protein
MFLPKKSNLSVESEKVLQLSIRRKQEDIGRWVRFSLASQYPCFAYGKDYQLMVTEIQCNDPSCVPIETLIVIIFDDSSYVSRYINPLKHSTKVLKPLFEVTSEDILSTEWPFEILDKSMLDFISSTRASVVDVLAMDANREEKTDLIRQIFVTYSDSSLRLTTSSSEDEKQHSQPQHSLIDFMLDEELKKKEEEKKQKQRLEEEQRIKILYEANNNITVVKMKKVSTPTIPSQPETITLVKGNQDSSSKPRHEKGRTMRGCPCCDPDNLDNKIDKMMFLDIPPN